jgi:hypothetical protein
MALMALIPYPSPKVLFVLEEGNKKREEEEG